jgi:cation transport ATPase
MKIFFTFIGVWFIASIINGLLSGICIAAIDSNRFDSLVGTVFLSCIFSFIFSAPLVGLVWLVATIAQLYGQKGHMLFQIILTTTLVCGIIGAVFFINAFTSEFKQARFAVGLSIIVSAISSTLIFRHQLKINE